MAWVDALFIQSDLEDETLLARGDQVREALEIFDDIQNFTPRHAQDLDKVLQGDHTIVDQLALGLLVPIDELNKVPYPQWDHQTLTSALTRAHPLSAEYRPHILDLCARARAAGTIHTPTMTALLAYDAYFTGHRDTAVAYLSELRGQPAPPTLGVAVVTAIMTGANHPSPTTTPLQVADLARSHTTGLTIPQPGTSQSARLPRSQSEPTEYVTDLSTIGLHLPGSRSFPQFTNFELDSGQRAYIDNAIRECFLIDLNTRLAVFDLSCNDEEQIYFGSVSNTYPEAFALWTPTESEHVTRTFRQWQPPATIEARAASMHQRNQASPKFGFTSKPAPSEDTPARQVPPTHAVSRQQRGPHR